MKRITIDKFIERANIKHCNYYNYSRSVYFDSHTKLEIICPIHGSFWQTPASHTHFGSGCDKCGHLKEVQLRTKSQSKFIEQANVVHQNEYNYSLVKYVNSKTKIIIICSIHGNFNQTPCDHLSGKKCRNCMIDKCAKDRIKTTKKFIEQAKIIHNEKYDYSETVYIKSGNKITIICHNHGKFNQTPENHLAGHGCYKCSGAVSKLETQWLNELNISENFRQYYLKINNKKVRVDGYNPLTNTVYEFYGDFWHGNPEIYNPLSLNWRNKIQFKKLYEKTLEKEKLIKNSGINLITIWENEYLKQRISNGFDRNK